MEERIMLALTDVRDSFIAEAMSFIEYDQPKALNRSNRNKQKWLRILLVAVIAALLAVTAFAFNLFGLRSYLVPSPSQTEEGGYISTNGYMDTPEGKGAAEWADFARTYDTSSLSDEMIEAWVGGNADRFAMEQIYSVYNDVMAQKLTEICNKYGLTLHTQMHFPASVELFYSAAGISPFLRTGEGKFQGQYIYEDGSFKGEGVVIVDSADCAFTLIRGRKGVLVPITNFLADLEDYSEWQYTTASGAVVDVAWLPTGEDLSPCFLFFMEGEYQITIYGSVPDNKDAVNSFAECFDFAAICSGMPNLAVLDRPATVEPNTESDLTWESFMQTTEWRAAAEFSSFCSKDSELCDPFIQSRALYGRGDAELDTEMERLCAKFSLTYPSYKEFFANYYGSNRAYPYEGNGIPDGAEWYEISEDEFWSQIGNGKLFEREGIPISDWYDTGAFYTGFANTDIYYMPKDVLFTYPISLPVGFRVIESWQYDTADGEVVTCVLTNRPEGLILYETENAYVLIVTHIGGDAASIQATADQIAFSMFP